MQLRMRLGQFGAKSTWNANVFEVSGCRPKASKTSVLATFRVVLRSLSGSPEYSRNISRSALIGFQFFVAVIGSIFHARWVVPPMRRSRIFG